MDPTLVGTNIARTTRCCFLEKGIQVKFFTVELNVGKRLKCIFTKFKLSTFCRFQDIVVKVNNFPLTSV